MLFKINLYTDKIPKENNQLIYNLRNNFSEFLKQEKFKEFRILYDDFQNKCRLIVSVLGIDIQLKV